MARTLSHIVDDWKVTFLTDGRLGLGAELVPDASQARRDSLLRAAGETEVCKNSNALSPRRPGQVVLVDAGPSDLFGSSAGFLIDALAEAGSKPARVDTVFATHLHPDHVAGLVTSDGATACPNAELVLAEAEREVWAAESRFSHDETRASWQLLAMTVLSSYVAALRTIAMDEGIVPGLEAMPLPGHMLGHCGLRIASSDSGFVYTGDILYAQVLQPVDPEIGVAFDVDVEEARATRKRLPDMLAIDGTPCCGGHVLQPALGHVVRAGTGYAFEPMT
jgi:glyoxylase-like metal-dependent hydrolase (beta-lactamase superfamily II)